MANHKIIVPFIRKWEGGLSRASTDRASRYPAPWSYNGLTGWHTNKGITFETFKENADNLGYDVTPENFFTMPDEIWTKIYKEIYWDHFDLDSMRSQSLANILVSWAWGSGRTGSFNLLKKYLATKGIYLGGTPYNGAARQVPDILNKLSRGREKQIFDEMVEVRRQFYHDLNQPANLKGWLNRLASFVEFNAAAIKKKEPPQSS